MSEPPHERRKARRFTLRTWARVILAPLGEEAPGQLIDLSMSGASITTRWAITSGVGVYVTFRYAGELCEATGRVLRVFPFGEMYGVAVEFGIANQNLGRFLREFEETHEASRPELLARIEDLVIQIA